MRIATKVFILILFLSITSTSAVATEISRTRYVWGGVTGTVVGFGIGHAIQERYLSGGGWTFTLCEGLGAAAVLTGGILYALANPGDSQRTTGERFMLAGAIFWGGFKVWENVDIWVAPNVTVIDAEAKTAAHGPVVGAALSW